MASIVNCGRLEIYRTNDGKFVGLLGHLGQYFGNSNSRNGSRNGFVRAADFQRRIRFWVECVNVTGGTDQKKHNATHATTLRRFFYCL